MDQYKLGIETITNGDKKEFVIRQPNRFSMSYYLIAVVLIFSIFITYNQRPSGSADLLSKIGIIGFGALLYIVCLILGKQTFSRQGNKLFFSNKIGAVKIGKEQAFNIESIKNMRLEKYSTGRGGVGGSINYRVIFDYLETEKTVLKSLTEDQVEFLQTGPLKEFFYTHGKK